MARPPQPRDRPVRVLLVDDDEDDYVLTREVIADIPGGGYTLDWESDFDAALEAVSRGEHDVYLVDFRLGAKTGLDLLAAVRQRNCPGPFILLTGVGEPEIDRAAEEAGAADYLEKAKLDPVPLERAIRYTLRQRAYEAGLERKVAERTAALERANAGLREADRRKDVFLATMAHELRNPLAPIRNALQVMRMTADRPEAAERSRQLVERQVDHLVRLIDDLLDASRMTTNKLRIDRAPVDLADPLRAAVETAQPLVTAAGLTLAVRLPDAPVVVHADGVRLTQLFTNLLANAAKYTEPGGRVTLAVEAAGDADGVRVRVADTGVGIPADMLPHVFDLFAQIDHSMNRSQGGLGIGLALAKRVAEMHGGRISAHSDGVGRGAEFVVELPLHRPDAGVSSAPPGSASGSPRSPRTPA